MNWYFTHQASNLSRIWRTEFKDGKKIDSQTFLPQHFTSREMTHCVFLVEFGTCRTGKNLTDGWYCKDSAISLSNVVYLALFTYARALNNTRCVLEKHLPPSNLSFPTLQSAQNNMQGQRPETSSTCFDAREQIYPHRFEVNFKPYLDDIFSIKWCFNGTISKQ